ncbi:MAG TPA: GFA family protein [Solirubrobacteraceae bacterium]
MATHEAACSCGQLAVELEGDPVRASVCHCLACQRRTGSTYGFQARWPVESSRITGEAREYRRVSDDGDEERRFYFCPECGATVYYFTDPEFIAIPVGVLGEPDFPPPSVSVYESRKHAWVTLPDGAQHHH